MGLVYVVGARPNMVKMAPVIADLRRRLPETRHVIVHTGQHYDRMMSEVFLEELGVPEPDYLLDVGSGTHAVQTARVMERIEPVFEVERPDLVIVPGDVNSTLAASLVAVKLGIPVAHVESGLRSYDRTMPEEINRVVTDQFADLLFIHSEEAIENLTREGIERERIHFVGNTMIDTLVAVEDRFRARQTSRKLGFEPGDYLLVTLHRPGLVDGPLLGEVVLQLKRVATELPVVFPVHPRTRKMLAERGLEGEVKLVDPVGYFDFLSLESDAAGVLTDSGGVQEETSHLGVPCFTLRDNTERPVTLALGTNKLLGLRPGRISEIPVLVAIARREPGVRIPLWDGCASQRIGLAIESWMARVRSGADLVVAA
jgi:UDP-N-acetylglucosamine 2-epimerase (non-hydrolysing)